MKTSPLILGIESSCDDTSVALLEGKQILSNLIANQEIHTSYGGVVPELASRAHQQNIVPVIQEALKRANRKLDQIDAIAYTRGPGLLGSLLVGSSFAKGLSIGLNKPLIEVNHMQAHILAHFIEDNNSIPEFPFLCLTVSGGHTQIVNVNAPLDFELIGSTIDDAAGEAFDKTAKMLGLPYPGGPLVDKLAQEGNPDKFAFKAGNVDGFDFSFSGLKTNVLYFLQKEKQKNPNFIEENINDICASVQKTIIDNLTEKLLLAADQYQIKQLAIAGGVSANSGLRNKMLELQEKGFQCHIPKFAYCTDNAAMIAMAGHFLYLENSFGNLAAAPKARMAV